MSWEGKGGPEGRQGMRAGGARGRPVSGLLCHLVGMGPQEPVVVAETGRQGDGFVVTVSLCLIVDPHA